MRSTRGEPGDVPAIVTHIVFQSGWPAAAPDTACCAAEAASGTPRFAYDASTRALDSTESVTTAYISDGSCSPTTEISLGSASGATTGAASASIFASSVACAC